MLGWTDAHPYSRNEAYEVARRLGIPSASIPCAIQLEGYKVIDLTPLTINTITPTLRRLFDRIRLRVQSSDDGATFAAQRRTQQHAAAIDTENEPLCFLSYAPSDSLFAQQVAFHLIAFGIDVWLEEWALKPGDSIIRGIEDALSRTRLFVTFVSAEASRSRLVQEETYATLHRAFHDESITVVPVLLEHCALPSFLASRRSVPAGLSTQEVAEALNAVWVGSETTNRRA
jgi:hypothetical protein